MDYSTFIRHRAEGQITVWMREQERLRAEERNNIDPKVREHEVKQEVKQEAAPTSSAIVSKPSPLEDADLPPVPTPD